MLKEPPGWLALPRDYKPLPVKHFQVERMILSRGSVETPEREAFVKSICRSYPTVPVEEQLDVVHSQIRLDEPDPLKRHTLGKKILVFGVVKTAVNQTCHARSAYPDYWHFSVYGNCPYGCTYCYLASAKGVWNSPTVKIFVNLPEVLSRIDSVATKRGRATTFFLGKSQDALALDRLSAYSTKLVPFFAQHKFARALLLTKSASVEHLLKLNHEERTTIAWSLNARQVSSRYEHNVPTITARLKAMEKCARHGYPVAASIEPVIPVDGWQSAYQSLLEEVFSRVSLKCLSFGRFYLTPGSVYLMRQKLPIGDPIVQVLARRRKEQAFSKNDHFFHDHACRALAKFAHSMQPNLQISSLHAM